MVRAKKSRLLRVMTLVLGVLPAEARAADLPDPPEIPAELMPHCTWNWDKVDPTRFEVRDGLVCAGRTCIQDGFYDTASLDDCGFSAHGAQLVFWAKLKRPRNGHPNMKALSKAVADMHSTRREAQRVALEHLDACTLAVEEVHLLTNTQAKEALTHCAAALEAAKKKTLREADADMLSKAQATLQTRMAASGGK